MRQVVVAGVLIALVAGCGRTILDAPVDPGIAGGGRGAGAGGDGRGGKGSGGTAGTASGRGGAAGTGPGGGGVAGTGPGGSGVAGTGPGGMAGTGTGGASPACSAWRIGPPLFLDTPAGLVAWTGREYVVSWMTDT